MKLFVEIALVVNALAAMLAIYLRLFRPKLWRALRKLWKALEESDTKRTA